MLFVGLSKMYGKTNKIVNHHMTHAIHVWYIYLHFVDSYGKCRHKNQQFIYGKFTSPMDAMGLAFGMTCHLHIRKKCAP